MPDHVIVETRQASHPDAVKRFDTGELRRHFLIERVFAPGLIALTYTHVDRFVVGGAMPTDAPLALTAPREIGQKTFLARREMSATNVGGPGRVTVDGTVHTLGRLDTLYVGMGADEVVFESLDPADPAKFYLLSCPAHASHRTALVPLERARKVPLGAEASANKRVINQVIHPDVLPTCQLVAGITLFSPGSVWNTMPSHTHDRRSEIYLYFDLPEDGRVFHMMGEPHETRHLVVANEQAIISPGWSIHSGVGTASYGFMWAMAGDNQDFTDMDMVPMSALR
ncbi:5-dehydro-4-deoxy-D-glucuronate isomerase [Alsobacter sp. SYSU M60028]|uniref:4-deoxy-L-threo-5-hexosulose-uronate ketol-isomerase n=1 Tax=Alsobacter ponti TaxID=2962936 RepID=A0ABT1LGL5_9HYPH|nr:5-dehydro-4-deoxy-D-glucuronate isomerase [Alsobacter ponti]MCP8940649.1 5-dehydro-4-deoxy-D-glucuronate isomerase [Alsobacter ponti]